MKNYIILHSTSSAIVPSRYDFGENLEQCLKFLTTMLINDPDLDPRDRHTFCIYNEFDKGAELFRYTIEKKI